MGLLRAFALVVALVLTVFGITVILVTGKLAYGKIVEVGESIDVHVPQDLFSWLLPLVPFALAGVVVTVFLYVLLVEVRGMIVEEEVY